MEFFQLKFCDDSNKGTFFNYIFRILLQKTPHKETNNFTIKLTYNQGLFGAAIGVNNVMSMEAVIKHHILVSVSLCETPQHLEQ
jgi:hypothetical protein